MTGVRLVHFSVLFDGGGAAPRGQVRKGESVNKQDDYISVLCGQEPVHGDLSREPAFDGIKSGLQGYRASVSENRFALFRTMQADEEVKSCDNAYRQ